MSHPTMNPILAQADDRVVVTSATSESSLRTAAGTETLRTDRLGECVAIGMYQRVSPHTRALVSLRGGMLQPSDVAAIVAHTPNHSDIVIAASGVRRDEDSIMTTRLRWEIEAALACAGRWLGTINFISYFTSANDNGDDTANDYKASTFAITRDGTYGRVANSSGDSNGVGKSNEISLMEALAIKPTYTQLIAVN